MAKKSADAVEKPIDPFLYYLIEGEWRGLILGVAPARPTMPDHLAKILGDIEEKLLKEERKKRPSESAVSASTALVSEEENGTAVVEEMVKSRRAVLLEEILKDPSLDRDAKKVLEEALREFSPGEQLVKTLQRATNTFPRSHTGNFVVPAGWFYGALKAALRHDIVSYKEQAQELVKGCVSIRPDYLDLGTKEPDSTIDANVPLPSSRPGEAQATIKRFHAVNPSLHSKGEFSIVVQILDSSFAKPLAMNVQRIFTVVGSTGLGGGRPSYGKFNLIRCGQLHKEEADQILIG